MESAECRRVSDAEQSATSSYTLPVKCEAVVKVEPELGECGAGEAAAIAGLYEDHEIKIEFVLGPEVLQEQDIAISIQNLQVKSEDHLCKRELGNDSDATSKNSHNQPQGEQPCSKNLQQQFKLRSCFVRLERIPLDDLLLCNTCPATVGFNLKHSARLKGGQLPETSSSKGHPVCGNHAKYDNLFFNQNTKERPTNDLHKQLLFCKPIQKEMVMAAELKSMGDLASSPPDKDKEAFDAVIASIDAHFPTNWRDWRIHDYSFESLFGGKYIPTAVDMKLRFAIPTTDLARAFYPSATSLSERAYRAIRHAISEWPLGRALLYAPHNLMEKIHAPSCEIFIFMDTVRKLKPKLIKRTQASQELAHNHPRSSTKPARRKRSCEALPKLNGTQVKRATSPLSPNIQEAPSQGRNDHLLAAVLRQQMELFDKMLLLQAEQSGNIKKLMHNQQKSPSPNTGKATRDLDQYFEYLPDSTESEKELVVPNGSVSTHNPVDRQEELRTNISEAQRELTAIQDNNTILDLTPSTTEKNPKLAKADPEAVKYGLDFQKLGQSGWSNVHYAELQKQFQATPVFSALKVNNVLASVTPNLRSVEILERFDMTLGAITHGLIKQRMIFQNMLDSLPEETKRRVGKDFVQADSDFRQSSDDLIQYTCGRRAEVLKNRRDAYKPLNPTFKQILREIPPSGTQLFEEKALSEAVKEQGGIDNFFPKKLNTPRTSFGTRDTRKYFGSQPVDLQGTETRTKKYKPFHATKGQQRDRKFYDPNSQAGKKWRAGRK